MDFRWATEDQAFRTDLQRFVKALLPDDWVGYGGEEGEDWEFAQLLAKKLGERGWLTMAWPREYGGQSASYWQQMIFKEQAFYQRLPLQNYIAINQVGPSIMLYGSPQQKRDYLPGIASGELIFCQMFTEPGAGSDLGGLQTRAIRDGEFYIINGQKIFTSLAHRAHFGWLAARTDPGAPKHRGISTFVIPTDLPGITILPLIDVNNHHSLNQVFFDNVRLPADRLVGEENRGWYQMMTTLDFERSGIERWAPGKRLLDDLVSYIAAEGNGPIAAPLRHKLSDFAIMSEVGLNLCCRVTDMQTAGQIANHEASISKIFNIYFYQGLAQLGVNLLGMYGALLPESKWARLHGICEHQYLGTIPTSISGGSLEVQKAIVATRGAGLPR
jgi:alkylation response protein AidB-like acyl-CoA dehydrogenase